MKIRMLVDGDEINKLPVAQSIVEVVDDVAKSLIDKKLAEEYTEIIEKAEKEVKIKEVIMTAELEVKDGAKIEVKEPVVQKKSFGESILMICKAVTGQGEDSAANGGALTYTELFREIVGAKIPSGVIWDKCNKIELGDRATAMSIPYLNNTGNTATSLPRYYPVDEGAAKTVSKIAFGAQTLTLKKQVVRIPMTWEIMEDVGVLETYVKAIARQKLGWMLDYLVLSGVAATNGYVGIGTAGGNAFRAAKTVAATITKASVINLISGVLPEYRAGAEFFMSNSAWASMMDVTSTASSVTPSFRLVTNVDGTSLMGYKVNVAEQLATLNSSFDIIFGNPKTYYVAYKGTPKELMSADFRWDYNESELVIEFRSAGAPCLPSQTLIDGTVCAGFAART